MYQLCKLCLSDFGQFFMAELLQGVWVMLVNRSFQMTLTWPLWDIYHFVLDFVPFQCCFDLVLSITILLEGEDLKQVLSQYFPVFYSVHSSFNSNKMSGPC